MKKVSFIVLFLLSFFIFDVYALDQNTLVLTDKDKKLIYNNNLFNENIFLYHVEMIPGGEYEDNLHIINNSNFEYVLYLRLFLDNDDNYDLEFMKNINFQIFLDNLEIFNGTIIDKNENNILISLGEYKNYGDQSTLKVITNLNKEYSNVNKMDNSIIHWEFVANYEDNYQIITTPNTGITDTEIIIGIIIGIFSFILLLYLRNEEKKEDNI
jgi:hypothetical protein